MPEPTVVHVVPALFGPDGVVGGAERYALELAKAMAARVPTSLVTFGARPRQERNDALTVEVLGPARLIRGQPQNPFSWRLLSALRRADVVHCHQQHIVASTVAALYSRLSGRSVFVSDLGGGGWDVSGYVSTDRLYHGHLHISEYSRQIFGHADDPRARVILGGVDTDRFVPDPDVRAEGGVLYVGRLLPHKGVNYLIEAMPPHLALTLIGPAPDERYLTDLRRLAQGKQVAFRGEVDDEELVTAYRRALCIVLPSVYRTMYGAVTQIPELLGQTLLEGMACGRPAVCTQVASLPEVVEDGVTGFVVQPNDAGAMRDRLEWLHAHPNDARQMGLRARSRAQKAFSWPSVVNRCVAAYQELGGVDLHAARRSAPRP